MPPPPGLNEIHVRSLEDLQLKVLKFRIDSLNKGPDHIPLPLHRLLFVGMGFLALVMTCELAGCRRLMRTARTSFRLLARHLRADSRSLRPLVEIHTPEGDSGHREPITSGFSRWDPAADAALHDLPRRTVARAMARGNDQGKDLNPRAGIETVVTVNLRFVLLCLISIIVFLFLFFLFIKVEQDSRWLALYH